MKDGELGGALSAESSSCQSMPWSLVLWDPVCTLTHLPWETVNGFTFLSLGFRVYRLRGALCPDFLIGMF